MAEDTETKTRLDAVAALQPIHIIDADREIAVIPNGYSIHDLEKHCQHPYRPTGALTAEMLESFAAAICRWAEPSAIILASPIAKRIIANFRHHEAEDEKLSISTRANWIDYKATLALTDAEEWKAWQAVNEKPMSQKAFFQFLEDRIEDVISPDPAELLEIAETIRGTRKVSFQNSQRMSNGDVSIIWDEVTEAKAGEKGQGTVPSKITIRVPIYEQAPDLLFDIVCSFRWRVENNGLQITVSIRHLATVQRMALAALIKKLEALIIAGNGENGKAPPIFIGDWKS